MAKARGAGAGAAGAAATGAIGGADSGRLEGPTLPSLARRCLPALALPLAVAVMKAPDVAMEHPAGGVALVPIAAILGAAISVTVPQGLQAAAASVLVLGLLMCASYTQELYPAAPAADAVGIRPAQRALLGHQGASLRGANEDLRSGLHLDTMSVVLPCAFEGNYAEKTVDSLWEHSNWRLKEVIVVDDGSTPPLATALPQRILANPKVRLLRHNKTLGLIAAKKTGGDAATSDIIVFFDCHINPRDGWEEAFVKQMRRAGDHRTVVVPTITSLNPDTWEEDAGAYSKACYVLWNADFTWLANPGRDVPLMSGGLLALTRKWWYETGGYDEHMVAWGGENIDQSLRAWLCGGRIEVAEGAFVAHMWRVANNPKTQLHYPIPTEDVMRNKGRAVKAWFSEFSEKSFTFPEYRTFATGEQSLGSFDNFDELRERQKCAPFSSYIQRFSYVYVDGGLIPPEVFQIREESTGLCLQRSPKDDGAHGVVLVPCSARRDETSSPVCSGCISKGAQGISELQLWHPGNRDRSKPGAPCCSGLHNWNFLQCLMASGVGQTVQTFECDVAGFGDAQFIRLDAASGRLAWHGNQGCVVPDAPRKRGSGPVTPCQLEVKPVPGSGDPSSGGSWSFQLRKGNMCLTHDDGSPGSGWTQWKTLIAECDDADSKQSFHAKQVDAGFVVQVGATGQCLDAAGGSSFLIYPCFDDNANQAWRVMDSRLVWESASKTSCVDTSSPSQPVVMKDMPPTSVFKLKECSPKVGQRFERHDANGDSFLLKDRDTGQCLAGDHTTPGGPLETRLVLRNCRDVMRWQELKDRNQVMFRPLGYCLDAGNGGIPILYPCHTPKAGRKQMFRIADDLGAVQLDGGWEDNGRKRYFPECIDHSPEESTRLRVAGCAEAERMGVRWASMNAMEPIEHKLWVNAAKPPPGARPLGGDAAPP